LNGTPVVAAINTSVFRVPDTGQPTPTDLLGLAVSNNTLVSPMHAAYPYFAYDSITGARIERDGSLTPDLSTTALAFAGMANGIVLWNDMVTYSAEQSSDLNARAAVGLSSDHSYLVLMTVDRSLRSLAPSYWGASFHDVGALLSGFGATFGLNLDGAGSTQLAWWDPGRSSAQLMSTPLFGLERHVGHNLGVVYQPLD
jgi:exopolysaccharide biosynthesis protein